MTDSDVFRPMIRRGRPQTNPNSLANLIPYKKGENGHGRVYPLKERLQHALDHPLKVPKPDAPVGERIVYATLKGALDLAPHPAHLKEVWDRVEGKAVDVGAWGGPVTINIQVNYPVGYEPRQAIEGQPVIELLQEGSNDD